MHTHLYNICALCMAACIIIICKQILIEGYPFPSMVSYPTLADRKIVHTFQRSE